MDQIAAAGDHISFTVPVVAHGAPNLCRAPVPLPTFVDGVTGSTVCVPVAVAVVIAAVGIAIVPT